MNSEKLLTEARKNLALIETKGTPARAAVDAAEKRRSVAVLAATLGDTAAQNELAAATVERDAAVGHEKDIAEALRQAQLAVKAAESEWHTDVQAAAKRKIMKLGEQRAALWDKVAEKRSQMFATFAEIESAGREISDAAADLLDISIPELGGIGLRTWTLRMIDADPDRFVLTSVTGSLPVGFELRARLYRNPAENNFESERDMWRNQFNVGKAKTNES
jgi:hypothetical protein